MKRILFSTVILLAALTGCQKIAGDSPAASGNVTPAEVEYAYLNADILVDGEPMGPVTRGSSTTDTDKEKAVSDKQFAIFNGDQLEAYLPDGKTSVKLRTGVKYTVIAVVNGPSISACSTKAAIAAVTAGLSGYNDPTADFVMYGTKTMESNLTSSGSSVAVPVSRLVSRVRLVSITKNIPAGATCTITGAYLSNVYTDCSLGGTVTASKYANWFGRKGSNSVGSSIIGAAADVTPSYDWAEPASGTISDAKFYTYPNSGTTFPAYGATFAASSCALVVIATWNGGTVYYPVPISGGTVANYTYDVTMTITGAGSSDPQVVPSQGSLSTSVTVNPWVAGAEYNVTY